MKTSKLISSAANSQYKQLKKLLQTPKERRRCQQTLLDGVHLIKSLIPHKQRPQQIFIRQGLSYTHHEAADCLKLFPDVTVTEITNELFDAISPVETPTGILALYTFKIPQLKSYSFGILLDRIQDPGNLGTLFRTVVAAGAEAVFLSEGCTDAWSPKTLRAGMGAHFGLDIYENADLMSLKQAFPTIVATTLQTEKDLYQLDLTGKLAFLFGNEGAGVTPELLSIATHQIKIPMANNTESLNVAAASAVCVFERVRQLTRR